MVTTSRMLTVGPFCVLDLLINAEKVADATPLRKSPSTAQLRRAMLWARTDSSNPSVV
jgi:hypothetical protein